MMRYYSTVLATNYAQLTRKRDKSAHSSGGANELMIITTELFIIILFYNK